MPYYFNKSTRLQTRYKDLLRATCGLSGIFSTSSIPFLHYRAVENIFCNVFGASNLSRSDIAYDAHVDNIGIGIKTFRYSSTHSKEKIAEFNALSPELRELEGRDLIEKVASLRNQRIRMANNLTGVVDSLYHCVARKRNRLVIFETPYLEIDLDSLRISRQNNKQIEFTDRRERYSFYFSKSVLFKNFFPEQSDHEDIEADIFDDPFDLLLRLMHDYQIEENQNADEIPGEDFVILPLYSTGTRRHGEKLVPEKAQLNQWNASGRPRDAGEVYIPVPRSIHRNFNEFFPGRDVSFRLVLPDNTILNAKICQQNGKALMTNPNNALAEWLLRRVLRLEQGELLRYSKLKELGVDAVRITKVDESTYRIDMAEIDSYDDFEDRYME